MCVVYVGAHMPQPTCGSQNATCQSQFSPTMWDLGIKLRFVRFDGKHLYPSCHLFDVFNILIMHSNGLHYNILYMNIMYFDSIHPHYFLLSSSHSY